ncbi:MAG TPA: hypothetical protein VGO40_12320 [Longimicrobium sp.]|jgi:hypothetical protein|nr:hypothetical protein [Longimicrobium sp.]
MERSKLELDSLNVVSFEMNPEPALQPVDGVNFMMAGPGGGYCCTGCVSGCGYNPTASGCASDGGSQYCDTTVPMYAY